MTLEWSVINLAKLYLFVFIIFAMLCPNPSVEMGSEDLNKKNMLPFDFSLSFPFATVFIEFLIFHLPF